MRPFEPLGNRKRAELFTVVKAAYRHVGESCELVKVFSEVLQKYHLDSSALYATQAPIGGVLNFENEGVCAHSSTATRGWIVASVS